jgi:hypothetical protein
MLRNCSIQGVRNTHIIGPSPPTTQAVTIRVLPAGQSSSVFVKLSSSICDDSTGAVADDALAAAMQQAAVQGLTNPQPLPTRCWYALEQQHQQPEQPEQLPSGYAGRVGVAAVAMVSGGLLARTQSQAPGAAVVLRVGIAHLPLQRTV